MLYELILTDNCNRRCNFCQIEKGDYVASIDDVFSFCNYVNSDKQKDKQVNLFGGEPLLNIKGIQICLKLLNENVKINLYTNGDFIEDIESISNIDRLNIQVTAYDIFKDCEKYEKMLTIFPDIKFTFTFDDSNINKVDKFKIICEERLNDNYKFALSHSNSSWNTLSNEYLMKKVKEITQNEIKTSICKHKISNFIETKVKRIIEFKSKSGNIDRINCISGSKKTFYKGKFLDIPCLMYTNKTNCKILNSNKCNLCKYTKLCTKSCNYELINNEVPEKLCVIEKTQFDVLTEYMDV